MIETDVYCAIRSLCRTLINKATTPTDIVSLPHMDEYILLDRSSIFYYPL
jgi:hypothetical protein